MGVMNSCPVLHYRGDAEWILAWILALKPVTTTLSEPGKRIAIWSLSPQTMGAYFAIFLVQYIPGIAFEAYTRIQQEAAIDTFAHIALEIIRASGPIGIGSAMNAIAVALFLEAVHGISKNA